MKILVVDDDLVTGALLNKILTKQGYEITQVIDGAKALEALKKMHKGSIRCQSEPGKETAFTVQLPGIGGGF